MIELCEEGRGGGGGGGGGGVGGGGGGGGGGGWGNNIPYIVCMLQGADSCTGSILINNHFTGGLQYRCLYTCVFFFYQTTQ